MVALTDGPRLIRAIEQLGGEVDLLKSGSIRLRAEPQYYERFAKVILKHRAEVVAALSTRCRCGSFSWFDHSIHGGESTRRDCARCGRTQGFPIWYGQRDETLQEGPQ